MAETNELVVMTEESRFLPVMSVKTGIQRYRDIQEAISTMMKADTDYGTVPGTDKPTLFKSGAEKLNNMFGLTPRYEVSATEDWTGETHGGEPFFYYRVKCSLYRGDYLIGEGEGSCNSWESKYRWRQAERLCPKCGRAAIIKSKEEYGGGWVCLAKKGGCGAKYMASDATITLQKAGRIPNPDIYDQVNVCLKMADKRALVAATLNATGASQFFTQDLEDMEEPMPAAAAPEATAPPVTSTDFKMLDAFKKMKLQIGQKAYYSILRGAGYEHSNLILDPDKGRQIWFEMEVYRRSQAASPPADKPATAPSDDEWDEWDRQREEK